jgi:hypothetical protein
VALPEKANGVIAIHNNIVTYSQFGRVGDGKTILYFWSKNGTEVNIQELPDVISEVVGVADRIYAGCRDGKLYAFLEGGKRLWSYTVPGSESKFDNEYMLLRAKINEQGLAGKNEQGKGKKEALGRASGKEEGGEDQARGGCRSLRARLRSDSSSTSFCSIIPSKREMRQRLLI